MFTVIICSADFIHDTKSNYSHIIDAISKSEDCALCVWNTQAETFEQALPDLPKIISGKPQWRAIVVQDAITFGMDYINKRNPFDVVGSTRVIQDYDENRIFNIWEELEALETAGEKIDESLWAKLDELVAASRCSILEHRNTKRLKYDAAVRNPLTKLGVWLSGISDKHPDKYEQVNPSFYDESTEINREYYRELLNNGVLVSEIEQYHILKSKYDILTSNFKTGSMLIKKPETILVVSERVKELAQEEFYSAPGEFEEIEYSNFCDDNLYVGKMRFLFFDITYENDRKSTKDYLAYLSSILTFAKHELPDNIVRSERVYKGETKINDERIVHFYTKYLSKLDKTRRVLLTSMKKRLGDYEKQDVSMEEAIETFEAEVTVPVVIQKEFNRNELMAKYKGIGLAKDCPGDEYHYWYNQVRDIMKKFIRFLREPRRALKKSVKTDFRLKNAIVSERAINLNEFQVEDIQYKLIEEEQKMIETTTVALFKTKEYTDKLEKADKEVRRGISQRMTRKKTVLVGVIAAVAYLFGFLPLIFSSVNDAKSLTFSAIVTGIAIALFLVAGFVFILVMRKRLVNLFKHFNYVMSGILSEIDNGLNSFSRYLSHACNVMREFSILNWLNKKEDVKLNIIKKHINDIEAKIKETEEMFAGDYSYRLGRYADEEPYAYDFTVACDYAYDIPYEESDITMEFISKDNYVVSPLVYIDSITVTREELYD